MSKSIFGLCAIIAVLGSASSIVYAQECNPALKVVNRTPFEIEHIFTRVAGAKTYDHDVLGPTDVISPAHDYTLDFDRPNVPHHDLIFTLNAKTRRPINLTFQDEDLCRFHYLDLVLDKAGFTLEVHD
jgi:hypothetical protein